RLQIQPRAPRVRRQEETRPRVRLEARDDLGALLLGHAPVEAYEVELALSEERLDEIEHRRPLGEERDLAIGLTRDLLEQIVEALELGGPAGGDLVHQERPVGRQ